MVGFKINSASLITLMAPKGTPYSLDKFKAYTKQVKLLTKITDFACVAEPCPSSPSDWHIHFWAPWFYKTCKSKNIHFADKLQQITKQTNTVNFTKPKKVNLFQKLHNDCRYALGLSKKSKDKHAVLKSPGLEKIHTWLSEKVKLDDVSASSEPSNLKAQIVKDYIQNGTTYHDQFAKALSESNWDMLARLAEEKAALLLILRNVRAEREHTLLAQQMSEIVLWPNQIQALKIIEETEPGRKLPCFIDPIGNFGKSTLQDYIHFNKDHQEFCNAKTKDIAYAYNGANLVTFNLARSTDMEKVNYTAIENLLDGKIFSAKYESGMKRFKKPVVAVFTNSDPDFTSMSLDRWDIFRREGDKWVPSIVEDLAFTTY